MATAPQAIWDLWFRIRDEYLGAGRQDEQLSGIVGDALHSFGYHLSPNDLKARGEGIGVDYSLQLTRDRNGAQAHPDMASALDVHFGPAGMVTVTKRLVAAAKARDPRLHGLREFCGTTNGTSPHPFDLSSRFDDPDNTQGWDTSHVTHVHLSIYRDVCTNFDAIKGIADVIAGIPAGLTLEEIVALDPNSDDYKRLVADIADATTEKIMNRPINVPDSTGKTVGVRFASLIRNLRSLIQHDLDLDAQDLAVDKGTTP